MTREMGKVLDETRGDVQEAIDMTYLMAGEGRRQFGQTTPSELPNKFAMSVRVPVGVAGLITPWNFPMAIPSWKVDARAGLRKYGGVEAGGRYAAFVLQSRASAGRGRTAGRRAERRFRRWARRGRAALTHPKVNLVSFTGSTEVGRIVSQACAPTFKKCHLEMGGKNIIIVMDDANLDLAVEGAVWGGFGTTGQRCTAASRVAVHKKVYQRIRGEICRARVKALKVGDGLDAATDMGRASTSSSSRR